MHWTTPDATVSVVPAAAGGAGAGGAAAAGDAARAEQAAPGEHAFPRWMRHHGVTLVSFIPLAAGSLVLEVVVLATHSEGVAPSDLAGAGSAVFFATVSAALLWVVARRLLLIRPFAAAAVFVFLFSPIGLVAHTGGSLQNAAATLLLAGAVVLLGRSVGRRLRMLVLAGFALVLLVVAGLSLVPFAGSLPAGIHVAGMTPGGTALAELWHLDPAVVLLGIGCSAIALVVRNLRPWALLSLALAVLFLQPGSEFGAPATAVWLPLAALSIAGVVQEAVQNTLDADFVNVGVEILSGLFLAVTVGVLIFGAPALAPGYRLLLPGAAAGDPRPDGSSAVSGTAAPQVPVLPNAADADAATVASAQAEARASIGTQLAQNPGLTLADAARAELRAGDVDVRSVLALGQLLASTEVSVIDFPVSESGPPRRQILIGAPNGSSADEHDLQTYFGGLPAPLSGAIVIETDDGGVLVTFPFGEPLDLLPTTAGR